MQCVRGASIVSGTRADGRCRAVQIEEGSSAVEKYRLTFDGWGGRDGKDARLAAFVRTQRGKDSRLFCLSVTGPCAATCKIEDPEELKIVLLRTGLRKVREMLATGAFDNGEQGPVIDVPFFSSQVDDLLDHRVKYCKYRSDGDMGSVCTISVSDDELEGMVLPQLCEACEIPDSDVACMHLTHLRTRGTQTMGPRYRRFVVRSACNLGRRISSTALCIPGACEGWAQEVSLSPDTNEAVPSPSSSTDNLTVRAASQATAERIVEEIDALNLVFRDKYGQALVVLPQMRTIKDISRPCVSQQDFTFLVAIAADLLDSIHMPDRLLEEQSDTRRSLARLERFLETHYPRYDRSAIQQLRGITRIRNTYPVHSRREKVVDDFRSLSIDYPTTDWQEAGYRILLALANGLEYLRTLIQHPAQSRDT